TAFRIKSYPTLVTIFAGMIFVSLQFVLYVTGGLVLFNSVEVESIFASNAQTEFYFETDNIQYNSDEIVVTEEGISLKPIRLSSSITYSYQKPSVIINQAVPSTVKQ